MTAQSYFYDKNLIAFMINLCNKPHNAHCGIPENKLIDDEVLQHKPNQFFSFKNSQYLPVQKKFQKGLRGRDNDNHILQ